MNQEKKPLKKFYQDFVDSGRTSRLSAELTAFKNRVATLYPESTNHPTGNLYFRQGWNSITLEDIQRHIQQNTHRPPHVQRTRLANLANARRHLQGTN